MAKTRTVALRAAVVEEVHHKSPFITPQVEWDANYKLTQLSSLLYCSYGVGAEWFEEIGAEHRDNILWLCSDLAQEVRRLMEGGDRNE